MAKSEVRTVFAKKSLGQNFLSDPNFIVKIVSALGDIAGEQVVEIGPGRGALTGALLEAGATVTAVELDRDMIHILQSEFDETGRFTLVEGDALKIDFSSICGVKPVKLVANLPYYISTAILQRLAEQRECFSALVLMLQKEVVERITAGPGESERGFLSVIVEANFKSEVLFDVPPNAFRPVPKVWSSVVRLVPKDGEAGSGLADMFRGVVSAGFSQRRKTILNNLKSSRLLQDSEQVQAVLAESSIDPKRRAETLTLSEWTCLANAISQRSKYSA